MKKIFSIILVVSAQIFAQYPVRQNIFNILMKTQYTKEARCDSAKEQFNNKEKTGRNIERFFREGGPAKSCSSTPENYQFRPGLTKYSNSGSGTISGKVIGADSTDLIYISAFDELGYVQGSVTVGSFYGHNYKITGLAGGKYYVCAYTYGEYIRQFYDNSLTWDDAQLVEVKDNSETPDIIFTMRKYTGSISGRITDDLGNVLQGYVTADADSWYSFAMTDDNGFYQLENLPNGECTVYATSASGNYLPQYYNHADEYSAAYVRVTQGNTVKNIDFRLDRAGALKVSVIPYNGTSLTVYGLQPFLYTSDKERIYPYYDTPDPDGTFIIRELPAGDYKFELSYENYSDSLKYMRIWYGGVHSFSEASLIHISPPDTQNIEMKLVPKNIGNTGAISGHIPPNSGYNGMPSTIHLYNELNETVISEQSDSTGNYIITGIEPAEYRIGTEINSISYYYKNAGELQNGDIVKVIPGDTLEHLDFGYLGPYSISGQIWFPNVQQFPVRGSVSAYSLEGKIIASVKTDYTNYIINNLEKSEYKLYFTYSGDDSYMNCWYPDKFDFASAEAVTAGTTANVVLPATGRVQGFIKDSDGKTINRDSTEVGLFFYDINTGRSVRESYCSSIGGYNIQVPPGEYFMSAVCLELSSVDNYAVTYYDSGQNIFDPNTKTIVVTRDNITTLNSFQVQKGEYSVSGSFIDRFTNEELSSASASILVFDEYGYLYKIALAYETSGKYIIKGLRNGRYYLMASEYSENDYLYGMWYGDKEVKYTEVSLTPKIDIPEGAAAVIIQGNNLSGVNFHITTGVDIQNEMPLSEFRLEQNFPNPFNPATTIKYSIAKASNVSIRIFDILGRCVSILSDEMKMPGEYSVQFDASHLASGVYLCRMQAENYTVVRKLLLLK